MEKEIKCLLLSADLLPNMYTIYQRKGGIDVHMYWVYYNYCMVGLYTETIDLSNICRCAQIRSNP